MRLIKVPLVLAALAASALLSGCATHTANDKTHTVLLGGLVEMKEGAYDRQPASGIPLNTEAPTPGSTLTGNKVSLLWGLITYRDQ